MKYHNNNQMKKIIIVIAMVTSGCTSTPLTEKQVCEGSWQYMSEGYRQKCASDRLIEALHATNVIHDTIYLEEVGGEWHRVPAPQNINH